MVDPAPPLVVIRSYIFGYTLRAKTTKAVASTNKDWSVARDIVNFDNLMLII